MISKLGSRALLCLCATMLAASLWCGQEGVEKEERAPVGVRMQSLNEHVAQQEARAQLSALDVEEEGQPANAVSEEGSANKTLQALETSEKVTQNALFTTTHSGAFHTLYNVDILGHFIDIEDGSVWSVRPSDVYKLGKWFIGDQLVITPNTSWFSVYNFRLTNQHTGDSVEVNLILGPVYTSPYTHWIIGIDYYNNIVYLEDGTAWDMSIYDSSIIQSWMNNDTVIIGINDGWLSYTKPNILINVNMLNYAKGSTF